MNAGLDLATARDFATALLIGALVGVEREKHKAAEQISGASGMRTFILLAECGALAAWLARGFGAPWLLAAALLAAALLLAAGYLRADPRLAPALGMTTESAALAVFLLGAVAVEGNPALAAALGIATSALLAYKQPLHRVVTGIGTEDFYAALRSTVFG